MFACWLFISRRMHDNPATATNQTKLLNHFFLFMCIFMLIMFLPHVLINTKWSGYFPLYMAYGYVFGHIFMYLSMLQIIRLFFSIVPRLNDKDGLITGFGILYAVAMTVINAVTMIGGVQPQFDNELGVTLFNAHPVVAAGIGIYAAATIMPATILMLINGFTNPGARIRSFLLGGGLLIIAVGGPIHDSARTANVYALADVLTIIGLIVCATGVVYRMEQRLSLKSSPVRISR